MKALRSFVEKNHELQIRQIRKQSHEFLFYNCPFAATVEHLFPSKYHDTRTVRMLQKYK